MSLTTDPKDPRLKEGQKNETGQHEIYLVLSEEERAKGFVRPIRNSYVHVGKELSKTHYPSISEEFEKPRLSQNNGEYHVAILNVSDGEGRILGGRYVTVTEYEAWKMGKRIGGCGTITTMGTALSETYARKPSFYGATFCCHCNRHINVSEFVWNGTDLTVGS